MRFFLSARKLSLTTKKNTKGISLPPLTLTSKHSKMYYKFNYQICFRRSWFPVTKYRKKKILFIRIRAITVCVYVCELRKAYFPRGGNIRKWQEKIREHRQITSEGNLKYRATVYLDFGSFAHCFLLLKLKRERSIDPCINLLRFNLNKFNYNISFKENCT